MDTSDALYQLSYQGCLDGRRVANYIIKLNFRRCHVSLDKLKELEWTSSNKMKNFPRLDKATPHSSQNTHHLHCSMLYASTPVNRRSTTCSIGSLGTLQSKQ
jgi:hypothetical protein